LKVDLSLPKRSVYSVPLSGISGKALLDWFSKFQISNSKFQISMKNPWFWFGVYYVFSALVSGMPAPDDKSGKGYKWAYASFHMLAANAKTVFEAVRNGSGKPPGPADPRA
jgi:hypothetical protein